MHRASLAAATLLLLLIRGGIVRRNEDDARMGTIAIEQPHRSFRWLCDPKDCIAAQMAQSGGNAVTGMENVSTIGEIDGQDRLRARVGGEHLSAVARGFNGDRLIHSVMLVCDQKSGHVTRDVAEQIDPVVGLVGDESVM